MESAELVLPLHYLIAQALYLYLRQTHLAHHSVLGLVVSLQPPHLNSTLLSHVLDTGLSLGFPVFLGIYSIFAVEGNELVHFASLFVFATFELYSIESH